MNSIDSLDIKQNIIKYGKYVLLILIVLSVFLLIKSCKKSYNNVESNVIKVAEKYVNDNNIFINNREFIEITELNKFEEIDGIELCSKASGVIITNENGKLNYVPYLKCEEYESDVDKSKNKYIDLVGDNPVLLNKGEAYNEQNYTLKSDADVIISGKVGTNPGVYIISYDVFVNNELKETAYRTVIVSSSDKTQTVFGLKNKIDPTLTLIGDTDVVLGIGQKYIDPGYTAVDYEDGKISKKVHVEPNPARIDTSKPGIYKIIYSVTNSKGRTAIASRTITVVRYRADLDISLTKNTEEIAKEVVIEVNISGNGYEKTISPIVTGSPKYTYKVTANGRYTFIIEDSYKNVIKKEIEINNIDNIPPSGICTALVQGSNTKIEVIANDNKGISGYSYILDGEATEFLNEASYESPNALKNVSVQVKDIVGNQSTLKCDVTVKSEAVSSTKSSGNVQVIDTSEYYLVSTKNDTIEFAKLVDNLNIAQTHPPGYPDYCLAFAYYHAYMLYNGTNLSNMTAVAGASYMYASRFKVYENDNKQVILSRVYDSINAGKPVIIHVNGNSTGTSRHYVTVVGYKKTVKSAANLKEEDLLIIDSYDGKLERMDRTGSRFMITGYDTGRTGLEGYGHQIYILN